MPDAKVKRETTNQTMKNMIQIIRRVRRPATPVYQQLELPLRGARLSREDCHILAELRKLREQLAKA